MIAKNILLFLLCATAHLHAMKQLTNDDLLNACQTQSTMYIQRMLQINPTLDINYCNEHGTTPLLSAAKAQTSNSWQIARDLLKMEKINYLHKDNYGQSLFSKSIYFREPAIEFSKILAHYTLKQINDECKSLSYDRNINLELHTIDNVINSKHTKNYIQLYKQHHHLPLIKKLFLNKALLDAINTFDEFNYCLDPQQYSGRIFYRNLSPKITFALREAFNYGPPINNYATLNELFINNKLIMVKYFPEDIITIIKTNIELIIRYQTIERKLWIKEDEKAQQFSTIQEKNSFEFIKKLMQLPQQEKTKLNIKIYMNMDREPYKH